MYSKMLTHGRFFPQLFLIRALLLVPIKVEYTLLQDHCKFKFLIFNFSI